jgi:hypothetical protein
LIINVFKGWIVLSEHDFGGKGVSG